MAHTPDAPAATLPVRLAPGCDLRRALEALARPPADAAFVVAGIGSLSEARIRFADAAAETVIAGPLEIVSLAGTLTPQGAHLHIAVSTADGRMLGGHLCHGSAVRTTAEVLLARLPDWSLTREPDARTGYLELVVRPRGETPHNPHQEPLR